MANSYRKAVGTTATLIADLATTTGGPSVLIHNNSGAPVFIGGSDVTASTSFSLATGTALAVTINGGEAIYGITSTTTLTVQVFRTNASQTAYHG